MALALVISIQATALGIAAAIYANTLIPTMDAPYIYRQEYDTEEMSAEIDWEHTTNIVSLEHQFSIIEIENASKEGRKLGLTMNNATLIFGQVGKSKSSI